MSESRAIAADDLSYLRKELVRVVLLCLIAGLYLWCVALFQIHIHFGPTWGGVLILGVGLAFALTFQGRRTSAAAFAMLLGLAGAVIYHMCVVGLGTPSYFMGVVVVLASLLFTMKSVLLTTLLCDLSVIGIGLVRFGNPILSNEVVFPVLLISAIGVLSSLAVRSRYLTLYWAWDRAMVSQRREEELRDHQGELARALKALDEAYHRLVHLNYELSAAREVAEEARSAKQRFVTNVSHELRTPLNVIVAFSEMMYLSPKNYGSAPLPAEYRGDVREIYRSSKHLLRLIDDVLDLSRIQVSQMKLCLERIDLGDVVAEALDIIRPLVQVKSLELCNQLPSEMPMVLIDRVRVRQVMLNLLNNARRFTDEGSISVRATLEGDYIRVTVADTGIGIRPGEQEAAFKEFEQLESSSSRREDGSGLGLAISKAILELHGGRIWLESEGIPGLGTQFHFTLPVAEAQFIQLSPLEGTRKYWKPSSNRNKTLLMLGADSTVVDMLERHMEEYHVVSVDGISSVPRLVTELHARAVLLNELDEDGTGQQMWQLCQELGELPLPVIVSPLLSERQLNQGCGVVKRLTKPVSRGEILDLLDHLSGNAHRILVVDDDPQMVHLLCRMIESAERDYEVRRAYNGQEGLTSLRSERFDLVLLDLAMPEMDGYALISSMQASTALRDIPVALITAHERTPDEERKLGGRALFVHNSAGFTNEESIACLQCILNVLDIPTVSSEWP